MPVIYENQPDFGDGEWNRVTQVISPESRSRFGETVINRTVAGEVITDRTRESGTVSSGRTGDTNRIISRSFKSTDDVSSLGNRFLNRRVDVIPEDSVKTEVRATAFNSGYNAAPYLGQYIRPINTFPTIQTPASNPMKPALILILVLAGGYFLYKKYA